ncbi:uncharacterized protein LOC123507169 isoform X1 [Portunus trituberculatus]|uniref:uncharacterized protein LOC123507169 isoform X1 n=2 Tax=Portunus trituberculatus TaxID=210409 RepID=UPI001E1D107B|nr:uncharacterized protein LOC123507169 isoform X1 [Portunus trituberculatus]
MMGMKETVTAMLLALMVARATGQFSEGSLHGSLNAGTDESDRILQDVLSDAKISGFVDCMLDPWNDACGERAPVMAIMIKFALRDNLECKDCSDRVFKQMKFIVNRLRSHQSQCVRLLRGVGFEKLENQCV